MTFNRYRSRRRRVKPKPTIIKRFRINSTEEQGMTVKAVRLNMVKTGCNMVITCDEDGFTDGWQFRVFVNSRGIDWKEGHFWVKRFFNQNVTEKILKLVSDYEDQLPF